jgi:formate hydrogenlyase subunit 4
MLLAGALGLARFFTVAAALDTGSAFEGMGASREVWFSALTEPALLLGLAALARLTGEVSLSGIFTALDPDILLARGGPALLLVAAAFCLVLLAENSRIPVDNPDTHLELTMVHEVMALDHGGPDLGLIQYGAALKLWVFGSLVAGIIVPLHSGHPVRDLVTGLLTMFCLAAAVGVVESIMARLRLTRVSQLIAGAIALSVLALMLVQGTP